MIVANIRVSVNTHVKKTTFVRIILANIGVSVNAALGSRSSERDGDCTCAAVSHTWIASRVGVYLEWMGSGC